MGLLSIFKREQRPNGRKPYEHRESFAPAWTRLPDSVGKEYEEGATVFALCLKYNTSAATLREKLTSLGVTIRPKGFHGPNNNHVRKLTDAKIAWLLEQDDMDVPHAEIARHLNVTRERVRQICLASNHPTRRSRNQNVVARQEAKELRAKQRMDAILELSEKWLSGMPFDELSVFMGHPTVNPVMAASRISYYRKRYPNLFPYRNGNHWAATGKLTPEERFNKVKRLSDLWKSDMTAEQVRQAIGYKTIQSVYVGVGKLRQAYPDLFPKRNPWMTRKTKSVVTPSPTTNGAK